MTSSTDMGGRKTAPPATVRRGARLLATLGSTLERMSGFVLTLVFYLPGSRLITLVTGGLPPDLRRRDLRTLA